MQNKLLWWILNHIVVRASHDRDMMIEEIIIPKSHFWTDMEIYYYPRKGHTKRHYEELTKHVETMKNLESHETLLILLTKFCGLLDFWFWCSFHMCPYKEWFDIYNECDASTIWMDNESSSKLIGIDTMIVKMFDCVVRISSNVKHACS